MYRLLVYWAGDVHPRKIVEAERAADVLAMIPGLLAEHDGCEHIVVQNGDIRLFTVDCHGKTTPG